MSASNRPVLRELAQVGSCLSEDRQEALLDYARKLLASQQEQADWQSIGLASLATAYGPDEPDYDLLLNPAK